MVACSKVSRTTLAQKIGSAQAKAVQKALKPLLSKAGVHTVEKRIGKPRRFFSNTRQRGTMKVRDFLAVCAALDLDPGEFIASAISGEVAPEIRPPRIVASAWRQIEANGPGLGQARLTVLETELHENPNQVLSFCGRELQVARTDEVPRVLGLYGSALRIMADLDHAEVVFKDALEIARTLDLPTAEPELLLRMAYLALEREQPARALRWAEKATLGNTRLGNREGQGRGFQALGMLRYYTEDHVQALREYQAALDCLTDEHSHLLLATHQGAAFCYGALGAEDKAWRSVSSARALARDAPEWMHGKLSWLEARLTFGTTRLDHLKEARQILCPNRPVDCALVTVELVEEAVSLGEDVETDVMGLCALLEKTGSPRIEKAIVRLVRHGSRLTPRLVAEVRRSLDRARDRRLSTLVTADLVS